MTDEISQELKSSAPLLGTMSLHAIYKLHAAEHVHASPCTNRVFLYHSDTYNIFTS